MEEKCKVLFAMNTIVMSLNNENVYYNEWVNIVPYRADEKDIEDCAENEEVFSSAIKRFVEIMKEYLEDGISIDGKLY